MWSSTNDDDVANQLSVLSTVDAASIAAESATPTECKDAIIQSMQNQLLECESKYAALQRSVPRLAKLFDLSGKDVTDEMTELTRQLTDRDYQLENANALCARKHEELELMRTELFRRLRAAEEQAEEATHRAKAYEAENFALREQIDNEQSRLFRLNQMGDHSCVGSNDTETLGGGHVVEQEILDKLQQELNDRLSEVEAHRRDVEEWRKKYETQNVAFREMKALNAKYRQFVDRVLSGDELRRSFLEKSLHNAGADVTGDVDYAVANLLATLELLDANNLQMVELREEVMTALRRHGYAANEAAVEALSQSLRHNISQHRQSGVDAQALDALVNGQLAQSSLNEIVKNTTVNLSILNRTAAEVSQDIGAARRQMNSLRTVCTLLFEKLRGTAEFLEQVLETLGETEQGREILKRIQDLRLDLDKSLQEANFAASEFEKAEKSMMEYCEMMSQLVDDASFSVAVGDGDDFAAEQEQIDKLRQEHKQLKAELNQLEIERTEANWQLERVRAETSVATEKLDELLDKAAKAMDEADRMRVEQSEFALQLAQLHEDIVEATEQLNSIIEERTEASKQLALTLTDLAKLKQQLDELLAFKDRETEKVKSLRIDKDAVAEELERTQSETAYVARQLADLQAAKAGAVEESERLQGKHADAVHQLEQTTATVKQLDDLIAEKNTMIQELERVIAKKTTETERLEHEIAEKTATIESLQSETNKENAPLPNTKGLGKQITGELSRIYDSLASAKATASGSGVFKPHKKK